MRRSAGRADYLFPLSACLTLILILAVLALRNGTFENLRFGKAAPSAPAATGEGISSDVGRLREELAEAQAKIRELESTLAAEQDMGTALQITEELTKALAPYGISLLVSEESGDITLGRTLLFAPNSYELNDDAKRFLAEVFPVLVSVLLEADNIAQVRQLMLSGHINPVGETSDGYNLSQLRALSVADYIQSQDYAALTAEQKAALIPLIGISGLSGSRPVKKADGSADVAASRRVEFKIVLQYHSAGE